MLRDEKSEPRTGVEALWEILLLSGADVSEYAYETRTAEGRRTGYLEWLRRGSFDEVVEAVRGLREDYLGPFDDEEGR